VILQEMIAMVRKIRITAEAAGEVIGEIDEVRNPRTVEAIWDALPIAAKANRWGEEIYFGIPVEIREENSQQDVEIGDLAYWPPGSAFCIFFGRTPVSKGDKPRAYSPVNVLGRIIGDAKVFMKVRDGDPIRIERFE